MITVCFIENIDPMGTHTGDSFCSAPMLTISEELQKRLQEQAYRIVESVQVIGGTNVQFAHDPVSDRIVVIEINPRTSRSSASCLQGNRIPHRPNFRHAGSRTHPEGYRVRQIRHVG